MTTSPNNGKILCAWPISSQENVRRCRHRHVVLSGRVRLLWRRSVHSTWTYRHLDCVVLLKCRTGVVVVLVARLFGRRVEMQACSTLGGQGDFSPREGFASPEKCVRAPGGRIVGYLLSIDYRLHLLACGRYGARDADPLMWLFIVLHNTVLLLCKTRLHPLPPLCIPR